MIIKRYESQGLAHFSYMIADQSQATLIDPRRDIDIYPKDARDGGYHIDHVLETHRNEDYLVGSKEVEAATGAALYHADGQWDYKYGTAVQEGQEWQIGRLKIRALHTPGHTPGSMSYLLHDPDGNPWIIFTGDLLFSGDVGRMDLVGEDQLPEMAGMLYDSIFEKVLPLGDSIIVCPAHGAGSVCGSEIAERTWTTIGLERQLNSKLQVASKEDFVDKFARMLRRPPYFRKMERLNLGGAPILGRLPELRPLQPEAFEEVCDHAQLVDSREQVCFGAAHLPDSFFIQSAILPIFAGWFLDYDRPVAFVCDPQDNEEITRMMIRIGFDDLSGYLSGGVIAWVKAGKPLKSIATISPEAFCDFIQSDEPKFLVDVRDRPEIKGKALKHAKHISLTQLTSNLTSIPKDQRVAVLCPSGNRAMIAASILEKNGWEDLAVPVGGLGAWRASGCDFDL